MKTANCLILFVVKESHLIRINQKNFSQASFVSKVFERDKIILESLSNSCNNNKYLEVFGIIFSKKKRRSSFDC